ncbi:N-acetylglucosamine kinase [Microbacterium schleiferi]|nr:BadF/BadG/BcrA/BcrD ATPase family protein [Microbacterium schleiferi]
MSRNVVAVDAGQTSMKVRVVTATGAQEYAWPGIRTHEALLPQLARVMRGALATLPPDDGAIVTAGVSGLTDADTAPDVLLGLLQGTGAEHVILAHDSITSFLGAIGDRCGAVVAAGTGVVTLAVGAQEVARVDGWGNIMGDAGSGYWIGREALESVMRAHDGRGPRTALTDVVRERWPRLEEAYIAIQTADDRIQVVAAFAEDVARLAHDDAVAMRITRAAARELALSAVTALERVGCPASTHPDVCAIGGAFRSQPLLEAFLAELVDAGYDDGIIAARGTGLDGATALAHLDDGHPLHRRVSVADPP